MTCRTLLALPVVLVSTVAAVPAADKPITPAEHVAAADAVKPSLVRVEYTLRYDKGEAPAFSGGWPAEWPRLWRYRYPWNSGEEYVAQERPYETAGFLLSPRRVMTGDTMIHPRFVKNVAVCFGSQRVDARIAAYAKEQSAALLEPAEPLADARPLVFDADRKPPYLTVSYARVNGVWTISTDSLTTAVSSAETNRRFRPAPSNCLIVDRTGVPVAMSMADELTVDDSWKGSPLQWPTVSADEMSKLLAALEKGAEQGLLRVALSFRSPKKKDEASMWSRYHDDEEEDATERNAVGVLLNEKRILVLANLKPSVTARLERILVHPPQGKPVSAKFTHTLSDYGCFLAVLEKPLPGGGPVFSSNDILEFRNTLLLAAEVVLQGENRVSYFQHRRITGFEIGWKRYAYPQVPGEASNVFLFDRKGELLALPIVRRKKVTVQEPWDYSEALPTPVAQLKEVLADPDQHRDPSNVPLTEEQENRLAWMGVELQALNKELARANNVSHLTRDGETGTLVTYVYPDSPAMKAGINPGFILLRLYVEGHPKPLEVQLEDYGRYGMDNFPWDQLDDLPEEYFDQLPRPWPSAEKTFTRALTDLGFGKKYKAEFFHDGEVITKDFVVTESPRHYDSAAHFKSPALGLTVRDLTYEVRRHYQKKPEDPGLIVSKIEPGSKASVSGIKPYEIITHVNDKPVQTVQDFEKLIQDEQELRLSVTRMTKGRLVKIKMKPDPKEEEPDTGAKDKTDQHR